MAIDHEKLNKPFIITSVAREDIESIGFDSSKLDDADMERIAEKMADAYCDSVFWIDLEIFCRNYDLPSNNNGQQE